MAAKRKPKSQEFIDDSDDPEDTGAKTKKARSKAAPKAAADISEEDMIPLSAKRFVSVKSFNGRTLVNIREYYTDDSGDLRPGKKGISLSTDQWEKLKAAMDSIDEQIQNIS